MLVPNWNREVPFLKAEMWILCRESLYDHLNSNKATAFLFRLIAACFREFVARGSKILVPCFREIDDDVFRGLSGDFHAGVDDVSPGMHARAFTRVFFEANPLRQNHAERVVNPPHFVSGLAIGNHMAHGCLHRLQHFDFETAACFPRPSFAPVKFAVNFCEFIPSPPIRENLPGEFFGRLSRYTILKSKHILLFLTPAFPQFGDPNERSFGAYSLYIVSLTM